MSNEFTARKINGGLRPYAVIDPNGPHGDDMVAAILTEEHAGIVAAALNASTTLASMGYDALECQKALPELVDFLEAVKGGASKPVAANILLTRLRVQEDLPEHMKAQEDENGNLRVQEAAEHVCGLHGFDATEHECPACAIRVQEGWEADVEYVCVNAHDRCYGGAGGPCDYCERRVQEVDNG